MEGDRFLLVFRQNQIQSKSSLKKGLWIYFVCGKSGTLAVLYIKETSTGTVWANCRDLSCDLRPVSSSPGVSLQANVLLRTGISCHGPASAAPRFNQALGSEIWAWRAGCTQAPFIWFQSSLRPRMWPRGHSFSRHWGGGEVALSSTKGRHICLEECVFVCVCIIVKKHAEMDSLWLLQWLMHGARQHIRLNTYFETL